MKKIICSMLLALFVLFPVDVLADGYISVSPSSLTIEQGGSTTFTITAYNAIGDVSISSNNSDIASVSTGEWGTGMVDENQTKTGYITVTGNSVGTTTITLTIDAATFDGDDLAGETKTITVNVVEKTTTEPAPTPNPTPEPPKPNNNQQNKLSKNNNIKELSIEGHEITKVNNNNYTLVVSNDVTNININAKPEDTKAKITGNGSRELQVGENDIEIVITSESGIQNKINIKVTRKDGYYLDDLNSLLENKELKDIDITINEDSKITKEEITKIKENKKNIRLNYYDENKKLIYSWKIFGNKIKTPLEIMTSITYTSEYIEEIHKLSNYADGIYINFKHNGELPNGTEIKLYVGDKFKDRSLVNVYYYDSNLKKLDNIKENIKVTGGYIEFEIEHCSEYFITMSNITNKIKEEKNTSNIFMIIAIIELILLILIVVLDILNLNPICKRKKEKTNFATIEEQKENSEEDIIKKDSIESKEDKAMYDDMEKRSEQIIENFQKEIQKLFSEDIKEDNK